MLKAIYRIRWGVIVMLLLMAVSSVYAVDLPPSDWYAVAWVQQTDRLHWINAAGEQASIARPTMPNEIIGSSQTRVHISPNGRTLVSIAPLNDNRWGIGFYDLASGQWLETHQSQINEAPPANPTADFTTTSTHFATVLRDAASGNWRVIVFDTVTGAAVAQLTKGEAIIPDTFYNNPTWYPMILSFMIDEGLGLPVLHLQLMEASNNVYLYVPAVRWYPQPPPALAAAPVLPDSVLNSPLMGIDLFKTTGQIVAATFDASVPGLLPQPDTTIGERLVAGYLDNLLVPLLMTNTWSVDHPQWLRNGEWIGYRVQNGVFQPHFRITTLEGGEGLPLGPNIGAIHATPDGFVAVDAMNWQLYHATALNFEGYAAFFGNTVFASGTPFSVIYTTPEGATFTLESIGQNIAADDLGIAQQPPVGDPTNAPDIVAPVAPQCAGAPAPRLTPGTTARVAFTNGQPLNLRNAPNGDRVGQLPEGTVFAVVNAPPQCANNYLWWNIQLNDASTYWVAEGDNSGYFIEPWQENFNAGNAILVLPTATMNIPPLVAVTAAPTPLPLSLLECLNSPVTRLAVGDVAHTIGSGGTLAVYDQPATEIPTYQLPMNHTVTIIGGWQCRANGARLWQISATLNNTVITGWVSEGFGQVYFLAPNPARAL